jgi:hypothetical protein
MFKREDKNIPMTNSTTTHLLALYFFSVCPCGPKAVLFRLAKFFFEALPS